MSRTLTDEQELELAARANAGDAEALAELMRELEGLVKFMFVRIGGRRFPRDAQEDILQAGRLGLLRAIRRHDPARGRLATYATTLIRWHETQAAYHAEGAQLIGAKHEVIRALLVHLDEPVPSEDNDRLTLGDSFLAEDASPLERNIAVEELRALRVSKRRRDLVHGPALRAARERAGLTTAQLGLLIGLSVRLRDSVCPSVQAVEGGRKRFSEAVADRALEVLTAHLLTFAESEAESAAVQAAREDEARFRELLTPEAIRSARLALGLKQSDLARRVGRSTPQVCSWELGNSRPTLVVSRALCALLRVGTDDMGAGS